MHPLSDDDLRFMLLVLASVPFVLWTAVKRHRAKAPPLFPHPATMRLMMFGYVALVVFSAEDLLSHYGTLSAAVERRLNAIIVPVVIFGSIAVLAGWFRRAATLGKEAVGFLAKLHAPEKSGKPPREPNQ
jgi:hypothetical protein